jgi:8-oxo-dGTP diphosphatase
VVCAASGRPPCNRVTVSAAPRIRVSAILRWRDRILLCRHEKQGGDRWLLPGGGVNAGESLLEALQRELAEEIGIVELEDELPVEGPVAIVDSISPNPWAPKHVVHIIFASDLTGQSLEAVTSKDAAVRGHRLFALAELEALPLHPPIQRFLRRWRPGDPVAYLGALWAR